MSVGSLTINALQSGDIVYLKTSKISSSESHFFIVLRTINSVIAYTLCCSSQETKRRYLERSGLPPSSLVYIKHNTSRNRLYKETTVLCHDFIQIDDNDLKEDPNHSLTGRVSDSELHQIFTGIMESPLLAPKEKAPFLELLNNL